MLPRVEKRASMRVTVGSGKGVQSPFTSAACSSSAEICPEPSLSTACNSSQRRHRNAFSALRRRGETGNLKPGSELVWWLDHGCPVHREMTSDRLGRHTSSLSFDESSRNKYFTSRAGRKKVVKRKCWKEGIKKDLGRTKIKQGIAES